MNKIGLLTVSLVVVLALCAPAIAQQRGQRGNPAAANGPAPANPRDLSGKWNRVSPFQSYSNVKGGANEFQNDILAGILSGKPADLNVDKGLKYNEPVFTPAGKAAFDKNIPSYGLRIAAPR